MIAKIKALIAQSQEYAKLLASLGGGLLVMGAQFIPGEIRPVVTAIVILVTAYSVYRFPNITPDRPPQSVRITVHNPPRHSSSPPEG